MSDREDYIDDEKIDPDKERREHLRTLNRYKHLQVDERAEQMDALKEAMTELTSRKAKRNKNEMAKDFLEKWRDKPVPDQNLINFLRGYGEGGTHNPDYEPGIPTGIMEAAHEMPWDEDDD